MEDKDTLRIYGAEFQIKCIVSLLTDKSFLERIYDLLNVEYWDTDANRWIVERIKEYFIKYKSLPTSTAYRVMINDVENDVLKTSINEQLKIIASKVKDTDLPYIKEQFLEFCRNQKLKNAIISSVDYLKLGQYDQIKHVVDEAMKAGMERNLGHEYLVDMDKRMSEMARNCVKTNWPLIDDLLDGGLSGGELAFVCGGPGTGKCVGSYTKIEIQYTEIGIPIVGNSGKEYIIWINPFKKYDFGNNLGELYGWQVSQLLDPVNIPKK